MDEDEVCGQKCPTNPEVACDKPEHPWGWHLNRDTMDRWAGVPAPARTDKKRPRDERVRAVVTEIVDSGRGKRTGPPSVGPPKDAVAHWRKTQAQWIAEAQQALYGLCERLETFVTGDLWPLVDDIPEKRAMVQVVRHGISAGWMHEESAMRVHGEWTTRDGVSFPLNKLVPIYRSDLVAKEQA